MVLFWALFRRRLASSQPLPALAFKLAHTPRLLFVLAHTFFYVRLLCFVFVSASHRFYCFYIGRSCVHCSMWNKMCKNLCSRHGYRSDARILISSTTRGELKWWKKEFIRICCSLLPLLLLLLLWLLCFFLSCVFPFFPITSSASSACAQIERRFPFSFYHFYWLQSVLTIFVRSKFVCCWYCWGFFFVRFIPLHFASSFSCT